MKQIIAQLQTRSRQILAVVLVTIALLVIPAFNYSGSLQAQAAPQGVEADPYNPVTADTVKRIQEKAEDLGDSPSRPVGQTGLKNIKKLGENIPETLDLKARQAGATFNPNEADKLGAMEKAQEKAEKK